MFEQALKDVFWGTAAGAITMATITVLDIKFNNAALTAEIANLLRIIADKYPNLTSDMYKEAIQSVAPEMIREIVFVNTIRGAGMGALAGAAFGGEKFLARTFK